jgi:adenosylhomocysteine nucleosidase
VGSTIVAETTHFVTDRDWSRNLLQAIPRAVYGPIAGISTSVVAHPTAKRALHLTTGALAVDNESHVVASVAAAHGLPMAAIPVILDSAGSALPGAALAAMRANGTIGLAALIFSLMKEPSELPMLGRTAVDALIGLAALLRCRRLVGPAFGLPALRMPEPEAGRGMQTRDQQLAAWKISTSSVNDLVA